MSTALILITVTLAVLEVALSLVAPSIKRLNESVTPDEEAEDLPFGPAPKNQD